MVNIHDLERLPPSSTCIISLAGYGGNCCIQSVAKTDGSNKFFHHHQDLSAAIKCEFKTAFSKLQETLHQ
jgi:hypothetical protein